MSERTDIHRPSAIEPADYIFVDGFVLNPPYDSEGHPMVPDEMLPHFAPLNDGRSYLDLLSEDVSPDRAYTDPGRCDHCGAYLNYVALYQHVPSGQFIATGYDCAENTMEWSNRRSLVLARQKKAMAAARKNAKEQAERMARLETTARDFPEAFAILDGYEGHNDFIRDVANRVARYGSASLRDQTKVMSSIVRAHERDLERAKERESAEPVPTGRVVITGEVLKTAVQENDFGTRYVMTVKDERGFVVWGSIPSAIDPERGDRVSFTGTLEPSKRDPKFGFFKRPSKARIIE